MGGFKGGGKPSDFYARGTVMEGHPLPATDELRRSDRVSKGINFPVLGIIDKVYFADLSTNHSNAEKNIYSSNVSGKTLDKEGHYVTSEFVTNEKGYRLEVDVKIVRGPDGVSNSGVVVKNVPVCISFGGVKNYGIVVPTPTTNVSIPQFTGTENGDWCLVQYIGGTFTGRVVTHIWPNQLNTLDPPISQEDIFAYARMAGTELLINKEGNVTLDARNAGEEITTDPLTGAVSKKRAGGNEGAINILTRNDVVVAAGFPRTNEKESSLPGGKAVFKASRLLSFRSTLDEVIVNTQADTPDGAAMQVKIQGERGSLRPVARKNDKIRLTDGDNGDLFSFIGSLYSLLDMVSTSLTNYSQDPGALAAGSLIEAFIGCHPKPTYAEGKIIEGSEYCQIAGEGTAADIGEDESGIVNAEGEQIPSEELVQKELEALTSAIPGIIGKYINPNPIVQAKAAIPGALQTAAQAMEKSPIPPIKAAAPAVKEAGKIIPMVLEMISTGSLDSGVVDNELPASATDMGYTNMDQVVGKYDDDPENPAGGPGTEPTGLLITPGLVQKSERLNLTEDYLTTIADSQNLVAVYTQPELEQLFGVPNSVDVNGLPTGPIVDINPATGTYWEVTILLAGPEPEGLNDVITVGSPGHSYRMGVQTDARFARIEVGNVLNGFDASWFSDLKVLPPNQQLYLDLGTASFTTTNNIAGLPPDPGFSAVLAAIGPVLDLVGPGLTEQANAEVDKALGEDP